MKNSILRWIILIIVIVAVIAEMIFASYYVAELLSCNFILPLLIFGITDLAALAIMFIDGTLTAD